MVATFLALCLALPSIVEASETTDKQVYRPFKKRLRRSSLTNKLAKESEAALQRSVRVFQQRYLLKRHRLELLAGGGMEFGDPMFDHYIADASLVFHLGPQWAIGITGSKFLLSRNHRQHGPPEPE